MQTFILKYKPYTIRDFFDDPLMFSALNLLYDNMNLLFVGAPSSGKTTLLYAMIRDYYGITSKENIPETNIMFINNLKEQGINFYRTEMKSFCQSHCTIFGKKKTVVIDDLDIINDQSQQVFLNYIDKYKKNVNFIAVCTNIQKVIEGIQSRMHILRIPSPNRGQLQRIMERIVTEEGLEITEDAKEYLLETSNMSIRCLINYLEKISILGYNVDLAICKKICNNISLQLFEKYLEVLMAGNLVEGVRIFYEIYDYGYSVIDILDYFFAFVKETNMLDEEQKYRIIPFLCEYITIFHNLHEDVIELALFTNNIYGILSGK